MAESLTELHVWPGAFGLASIDPSCLAAVLHLQLVIPGRHSLVESTTPDNSPSGQLPYLAHDLSRISSLSAIMKYVSGMPGSSDLDCDLSVIERTQTIAWCTHALSHLGDLVAYSFYSSSANYWGLTHPTLANMLPVPQRYYVPGRIRESYKPRLESAGLWNCPGPEREEARETSKFRLNKIVKPEQDIKDKMKQAFAREQILDKARACLEIYSKLLEGRSFFFYEKPTTLDIVVASHILLLLNAPFPDAIISDLLMESFPSLVIHARLVLFRAFPLPSSTPHLRRLDLGISWRSLIPCPKFGSPQESSNKLDRHFTKMRWGWIGMALLSTTAYFWMNPIVIVIEVPDEAEDEPPEDETDDDIEEAEENKEEEEEASVE